jgi:hypothetical protein
MEDVTLTLAAGVGASGMAGTAVFQDGTAKNLAAANFNVGANANVTSTLIQLPNLNVRFSTGVSLIVTLSTNPAVNVGTLAYNLYYRTP